MARNDFNGDGRSDILWLLNGDNAVSNWLATSTGGFTANDSNAFNWLTAFHQFRFTATGDFNGDGRTDLLWAVDGPMPDQGYSIWFSGSNGGSSIGGPRNEFVVDSSWKIAGAGDFNGDGADDILWRHENGTVSNWLGSPSGSFTVNDANAMTQVSNEWRIAGTGDFDGDGRTDILWRSDSGMLSNWLGTASGGFLNNDGNALEHLGDGEVHIGDFDGDGRDDLLLRSESGGMALSLAFESGGFDLPWGPGFVANVPTVWQIAAIGDYNRDGIDDILWRHENGALSNWLGTQSGYDFIVNDANALVHVPNDWQVADQLLV